MRTLYQKDRKAGIEQNDMMCYVEAVLAMKNIILLVLAFSFSTHAALGDVCSDLARLTSAPGVYSDGTGKDGKGMARNANSLVDFAVQIEGKFRPVLVDRFKTHLKNPLSAFFMQTAISALRFDCDPACENLYANGSWDENLLENVSQALAGIVFERILPQGLYTNASAGRTKRSRSSVTDIEFLLNNHVFVQERDRIRAEILQHFGLIESSELVEKSWNRVLPIFETVVSQVMTKDAREFALQKIRDIRLVTRESCAQQDPYARDESNLETDMIANAFYDPVSNTVSYCKGLIILNQSEFGIAFVLAHELAHSIDPCNIAIGPGDRRFVYSNLLDPLQAQNEYPIPGLISCLRDPQSIGAIRRSFKLPEGSIPEKSDGSSDDGSDSMEVLNAKYSVFCSKDGPTAYDQINEAIPDWFGTEVLARYISTHYPSLRAEQYIYGYSNVFRGMYSELPTRESSHPGMSARINRILLSHPEIRKDMECPALGSSPADPTYCAVPLAK